MPDPPADTYALFFEQQSAGFIRVQYHHHRDCKEDASSRNDTMSNLPGPGRMLDNVFQTIGWKLEKF